MPSQSVEAATRDEAIAAARAEFGPSARVVGVRRIRTGGVMGFFSNERYVAEVELDARPAPAGAAAAGSGRASTTGAAAPARDRAAEFAELLGTGLAAEDDAAPLYSRTGARTTPASPGAERPVTARARTRVDEPRAEQARVPQPRTEQGRTSQARTPRARVEAQSPVPAGRSAGPARPAARGTDELAEWLESSRRGARAAEERWIDDDRWIDDEPQDRTGRSLADDAPVDDAPADDDWIDDTPLPRARPAGSRGRTAPADRRSGARSRPDVSADQPAPAARPARAAEPAAEFPSPFRTALARMVANDQQVALAVAVAVAPPVAEPVAAVQPDPVAVTPEPIAAPEPVAVTPQPVVVPEPEPVVVPQPVAVAGPVVVEELIPAEELLEQAAAESGVPFQPHPLRGRHRLPEQTVPAAPITGSGLGDLVARSSAGRSTRPAAATVFADVVEGELVTEPIPVPSLAQVAGLGNQLRRTAERNGRETVTTEHRIVNTSVEDIRIAASVDGDLLNVRVEEVLRRREERVVTHLVGLGPSLARTASDPAPLPMDATMMLPALSFSPAHTGDVAGARPPVPSLHRGRPPVPPTDRARRALPAREVAPPRPVPAEPSAAGPSRQETGLATVTRLRRAPAGPASRELVPFVGHAEDELAARLLSLGVPHFLLGADFAATVAVQGVYAALVRTLAEHLPPLPQVPTGPGATLLVIGPGAETLKAARSLALSLRLDPDQVLWASTTGLAPLAAERNRITSLESAADHRRAGAGSTTATIVAVDVPLHGSGAVWLEHMSRTWEPDAVWAVVDSTRKPEDLGPWLATLPRLDAVVVEDTASTADPAAVLGHVTAPVARVDGVQATAHRWASLLCERLDQLQP